ncbi:hypothetical protein A9P82_00700 [Arachidicoccus ginsenosidimutans]|uniref:hypothetical protein n=1 Tax=Arachidicoccus sp. BS20 TaxID=1850526 RepID=UPI0007F08D59|nr:hypothetical protein [Arachidicoccus sp. BS20]ANI87962.1 hypothetical protein A9P82_00700 [Arachidicoccus sp. BS20]
MKKFLFAILPLAVLASCGASKERKLLVVASGEITVSANTISIGDTSGGASNQEIDLKDASQGTFSVTNNGVKSSVTVPAEAGYYIYNAGTNAVYGSQLIEGKDYNVSHELDLDEQKAMIDSLTKVLAGTNISAANKNYLINPGQIVKLNDDVAHTQVFAPFQPLGDIAEASDGKPTVLYKFYSKDELQTRLKDVEDSYNAQPQ